LCKTATKTVEVVQTTEKIVEVNEYSGSEDTLLKKLLVRANRRVRGKTTMKAQQGQEEMVHVAIEEINTPVVAETTSSKIHMSWTWDDLKTAQKQDEDIGFIEEWFSEKTEQPPCIKVITSLSEEDY